MLKHIRRGLLYEDNFTLPAIGPDWWISEASRVSVAGGFMRMEHGSSPLYVFLTMLQDTKEFVLDVKNNYNPTAAGSSGGVIVFGSEEDYISLDEYFDEVAGTAQSYPWLRLIRDYSNYTAFWSVDGVQWSILGTLEFPALVPQIGLFLNGEGGAPLDVEYVRVFSAPHLTVSNLARGCRVELRDVGNNIVATQTCRTGESAVRLSLHNYSMPFNGSLSVFLTDNTEFATAVNDVWGGDEYVFAPAAAALFYTNEEGIEERLQNTPEKFLGYMNTGNEPFRNIKFIVRNTLRANLLRNVVVDLVVQEQLSYAVKLALDDSNRLGEFVPQVTVPTLAAGAGHAFWVRLERSEMLFPAQVEFNLNVSSALEY